MLSSLNYIVWTITPEMISGWSFPRWYGLLFASGFIFGQIIMARIFSQEKKPAQDLDTLLIYMVVSTVLGARLGHCLFYQPEYYLANPIEILKIWEGGLASHGAAIGILLALYLYSRNREGQSFLWVLDRIVIVVALAGAMIRFGNLANSEIIGKPTNESYAFIFQNALREELIRNNNDIKGIQITPQTKQALVENPNNKSYKFVLVKLTILFDRNSRNEENLAFVKGSLPILIQKDAEIKKHFAIKEQFVNNTENTPKTGEQGKYSTIETEILAIPRHPAQLYEALSCLLLFGFLFFLHQSMREKTPEGILASIFLIVLFVLRFLYEFLKENQVAFEDNLSLNMGQWLSIPAILMGIAIGVLALMRKNSPQAPKGGASSQEGI